MTLLKQPLPKKEKTPMMQHNQKTGGWRKIPHLLQRLQRFSAQIHMLFIKYNAHRARRNVAGVAKFKGFQVAYTDKLSFYMEYKDIFFHRIYHFEAQTPSPYIIDGGGCIGMSVLYFRSVYPNAKILCFEPDETLFQVLQRNLVANGIANVELVQAALSEKEGFASFVSDRSDAGKISDAKEATNIVNTVRLSEYLSSPVDFLKLNIEGQELPVLLEVEACKKLRNVREMIIEYHGWADTDQCLGDLLNLLKRNGFHYLVHDFDTETCGASKPPFRWTPDTTWFCLVYAKRIDNA